MATRPDGERIAQLEIHLSDFEKTNAQSLSDLKLAIKDISLEIKDFRNMTSEKYVTKDEFQSQIIEIKKAIQSRDRLNWFTHTTTAFLTAVLTILLTLFFTNKL